MKFSIDDQVAERCDIHPRSSFNIYKVIGFFEGAVLATWWGHAYDGDVMREDFLLDNKPGTRSFRTAILRFEEKELITPEEAFAEQKVQEAARNKMEEEFEGLRSQIREKMDQASLLVDEAVATLASYGKSFIDLQEECSLLSNALDRGGWRESSMHC